MTDETRNEDLLAAVDGAAYPLSNEEVVFRTRAGGDKHVMTLEVLQALDACSRFQTMGEHVSAVTRTQRRFQGREDAVRRLLQSAMRQGLFVSADDMLASPAAAPPGDPDGPAPVFIRAGGRVEQLEALLASALELASRCGRRHRYYAVSDATDKEAEAALQRVVNQAAGDGLDCRLLDREWQREFVSRVLKVVGRDDDDALRAMLLGEPGLPTGAGRLRNIIALVAAGHRHLVLDDDLLLAPRRDPAASGVALDTSEWQFWFAGDADAIRDWGEAAGHDPVFEHYRALGLNGLQALRRYGADPACLAGLDNRELQRMARGSLLATQSGLYGDAASSNNIWYFTAAGASRERLCAGEAEYQRFRDTRSLARVRHAHALQSVASFCPIGGADDHVLPPTLHVGGNEDLFYSRALNALYPDARVLEFPWALGHFPEPRRWPELAWEKPFTGNLARWLSYEIADLAGQVPEVSGAARFRLLGERLDALVSSSDGELLERVVAFQVDQRITWIQAMQRALGGVTRRLPAWERDIRAIIQVNGQSLEAGVPRGVAGMPGGLDDAAAGQWLRDRVAPLARTLSAWPDLWQAARSVRALPELDEAADGSAAARAGQA